MFAKMFSRVGLSAFSGVAVGSSLIALQRSNASCSDAVHPPALPWSHGGLLDSFDTASVRRGLQVYQQVCAACHSLESIAFRQLVGVTHDEAGAKALAAKYDIKDGPDATGEMFTRPGRLPDTFPGPYANEDAARHANGGALPPDLSLIVKARHGGEDYIFALLTGYSEPPAGITLRNGLYYNPYFPGGAISMPPPILDGQIDYADPNIPTTQSQLAKDVTTFLAWVSEPTQDERKLAGLKAVTGTIVAGIVTFWYKRFRWGPLKTRKFYWADEVKRAQESALQKQIGTKK